MTTSRNRWTVFAAAVLAAVGARATPITAGDLLIYRVDGNGAALGSDAALVYLDEYTPSGTLVQSFAMPGGASGTRLTSSGSASSEGKLTVSPDGRFVAMVGYDAAENTLAVKSGVNRTIAVFSTATGVSNLTTGTLGGNDNARGVAVDNTGTNLWLASAGGAGTADTALGLRYLYQGQTTAGPLLTNLNTRGARIFGDQLYEWGDANGNYGIFKVGSGLPTTANQTLTGLTGLNGDSTLDSYGFFMADLDSGVAGYDTLWLARDTTGVSKYSLVGGTWALNNTIDPGGVYHIDGSVAADGVTLAIVEGQNNGVTRIMTLKDSAGYNQNMPGTFTELIPDGNNQAFRGVAFVIPEPTTAAMLGLTAVGLVMRRRMVRRRTA